MSRVIVRSLLALVVGVLALLGASPAVAGGSVGVDNGGRGAVIDSRYSSELTVTGRGFQSIKGGHGGIYVWFGTVSGQWRPSQGGRSGIDYLYVPDSESKNNAGFQRFVAFPGSDTASAANGGTMSASGSWSVRLVVPGPTFEAVGRNGAVRTVDCRKVTCGVITVGAHGVRNANNESFTPVAARDLAQPATEGGSESAAPTSSTTPTQAPAATSSPSTDGAGPSAGASRETQPPRARRTTLEVDRASAIAGRALSFVATGLSQGEQFSVVLDDGLVASGPHVAGAQGRATGVISLPADLDAGTHELRIFGASKSASVKFGVAVGEQTSEAPGNAAEGDQEAGSFWEQSGPAIGFAVAAGVVFLIVLVLTVRRLIGARRAYA